MIIVPSPTWFFFDKNLLLDKGKFALAIWESAPIGDTNPDGSRES
jgi:hypothetical protein